MIKPERNVELSRYTTFGVGGPAELFLQAKNKDELVSALSWARKSRISYTILGGGSNVLISDAGLPGLVIAYRGGDFKISGTQVISEGGTFTARLALATCQQGLGGLEFATSIPGTIAGAVVGNAGAYGSSMENVVTFIEVWSDGQIQKMRQSEIGFSYRSSDLLDNPERVILTVELCLEKKRKLTDEDLRRDREKRAADYGGRNAGSYFRNFEVSQLKAGDAERFKKFINHDKLSTGALIESLGLKGKAVGGACVSEKHGNVLLNTGSSTAYDVYDLARKVKEIVYKKTGIKLVEEVRYLGEFS